MTLHLRRAHANEIRAHGRAGYPHEVCGALLGTEVEGVKIVHELSRFENARVDSSHNRFLIEPRDLLRAQRAAATRGLEVIGIYHSHPDVAARPSQFDREHAWTWYSYVIVSVREGKPEEIASWVVPEESAPFAAEAIEVLE